MTKPNFAKDQLRSLVERVERLEEEKRALGADISEVFKEAKGHGFDTKIMRQVIKLRQMDQSDRQEREALLDLYLHALGMDRDAEGVANTEALAGTSVSMLQAAE